MEKANFTSKIWRILSSKENTTDWSLQRSGNRYFLNWSEKRALRAPVKNAPVCQVEQNLKIGRPSMWKTQQKATKRKYKSPSQMRRDRLRWEAYYNKESADVQEIPTTALQPTIGEIFPFEDLDYRSSKNRERLSLGEIFQFEDLDIFCQNQSLDEEIEQFTTPPSTPKLDQQTESDSTETESDYETDEDNTWNRVIHWLSNCYIHSFCPRCKFEETFNPLPDAFSEAFLNGSVTLPDEIAQCSVREDFDANLLSFQPVVRQEFRFKQNGLCCSKCWFNLDKIINCQLRVIHFERDESFGDESFNNE